MNNNKCKCHKGKREKFIQPCILLLLINEENYGYMIIDKIKEFGFYQSAPDVSVVYRNLNKMESEGYIESRWVTNEPGPAKKIYKITEQGKEYLESYVQFFKERKELFERFIEEYNNTL